MNLLSFIPRRFACCGLRSIVFILTFWALVGCDFNPNERVDSTTRPENHTTPDGVVWVAPQAGPREWFYVPREASIASRVKDAPADYKLNLLLDSGKIYQITSHGDGSYVFNGYVDAPVDANPGMTVLAVLLGVVAVFGVVFGFRCFMDHEVAASNLDAERGKLSSSQDESAELQRKLNSSP